MPMNNVLVVIADPEVLEIAADFLRYKDFTVARAASGLEALQQAVKNTFEVILLDISISEMGGIDALKELKMKYPTTEVIMVTHRDKVPSAITCIEKGAYGYLVKPLDFNQLHLEVNRALERRRMALALDEYHKNLELKVEELQNLNEQKNRFLGMAAHDLRNPLATIRGLSELLLEEDSSEEGLNEEEAKEFLQIINTTSHDMLHLVNDLLDVSQIESGKFDLRLDQADLSELVEKRAAMLKIMAAKKKISLDMHTGRVLVCLMDKERITQVFDNLVSNAIKFSPEKTTVRIDTVADGAMAKVTVHDEGPGINENDRHKLFGEFQKLSARPTAGEKSSGLGLAIAKKIVEAHKGEIGVENTNGKGSAFYFTIPLNQ